MFIRSEEQLVRHANSIGIVWAVSAGGHWSTSDQNSMDPEIGIPIAATISNKTQLKKSSFIQRRVSIEWRIFFFFLISGLLGNIEVKASWWRNQRHLGTPALITLKDGDGAFHSLAGTIYIRGKKKYIYQHKYEERNWRIKNPIKVCIENFQLDGGSWEHSMRWRGKGGGGITWPPWDQCGAV